MLQLSMSCNMLVCRTNCGPILGMILGRTYYILQQSSDCRNCSCLLSFNFNMQTKSKWKATFLLTHRHQRHLPPYQHLPPVFQQAQGHFLAHPLLRLAGRLPVKTNKKISIRSTRSTTSDPSSLYLPRNSFQMGMRAGQPQCLRCPSPLAKSF